MSAFLVVALILAFGLRPDPGGGTLPPGLVRDRVKEAILLGCIVVTVSFIVGRRIAALARRRGGTVARCRQLLVRWGRLLDGSIVLLYVWLLYGRDWPRVVESGLVPWRMVVIDEALILVPYLVFQLLSWWGLSGAEVALRAGPSGRRGFGAAARWLIRRARQSFGLVLPAALVFAVAQDLARRYWATAFNSPLFQLGGLAVMGATVLVLAPALVRLAWPARRLAPGPLRDRLQQLAARLGFRYTDILIWDTDRSAVNAGVTGALPFFRYVLLTDALIETLDERQVEAVFGHEVGHIAHRHLSYFGFFFVGSMGIMALVGQGFSALTEGLLDRMGQLDGSGSSWAWALELAASAGWLVVFLGYVLLVFGYLSRRFERQADVYGCRAISCGQLECPPHSDPVAPGCPTLPLCPTGIHTFASALELVARLNGMQPGARSWRHGSIQDRVTFLHGLVGSPAQEHRFQRRVQLLRATLAIGLLSALAAALATGALDQI
jgi:STE24 endopeptidase